MEQQQDKQYHQNDTAQAHSGMAHAIAIAAEPPAEAAEQINDHNDDQDQTKRHGTLLLAAGRDVRPPPRGPTTRHAVPRIKESTIRPLVPRGNQGTAEFADVW